MKYWCIRRYTTWTGGDGATRKGSALFTGKLDRQGRLLSGKGAQCSRVMENSLALALDVQIYQTEEAAVLAFDEIHRTDDSNFLVEEL